MTPENEYTLLRKMIRATERQIKKRNRDKIYLIAELKELYKDLKALNRKSKVIIKVK